MNVRIVSTDEVLWAGKASSVVVPSIDGDLGILPGRQPILAVLRAGKARVTAEDGAVVVATPVPTHYELARQALAAGKHVFVEKPPALSGAEAEVSPDFMEIGSFIGLAAVTRGELAIEGVRPDDLRMMRIAYAKLGIRWEIDGTTLRMNLDPARSTLSRSADWPILLSNLIERVQAAGPALRAGFLKAYAALLLVVGIALALLVVVALGVTAQEVKENPTFLIAPSALIIGIAAGQSQVSR